ncbi:MAG: hypothetical protein JW839_18740 [Candidatus Lokiarchaeota archaeon]|nr:hypothetical protein [Candidatus Lokiarchaeota archaeon]
MPFKKEFDSKLEPLREMGFILTEIKELATYSEIKITNKGNGMYIARVGFQPVVEKDRDEITETITKLLEKYMWEKE